MKKLKEILMERKAAYNSVDIKIDTSSKKPDRIAEEIINRINKLREN